MHIPLWPRARLPPRVLSLVQYNLLLIMHVDTAFTKLQYLGQDLHQLK